MIIRIIEFLSRIFGYMATCVLGLMMLLTVADVGGRYFFNSPILGTTEISESMMAIIAFPALAWCAVARRHVKVDLVVSHLPQRTQLIIDSITLLLALGTYVIISWQSFLVAREVATESSLLRYPIYPFYWVLTAGFAVFCLAIATLVFDSIREVVKK